MATEDNNSTPDSTTWETTIWTLIANETTEYPKFNSTEEVTLSLAAIHMFVMILCGFIILTNLSVVLSSGLILKKGITPKTTYLFLGNVAMSDLVVGLAVLFGVIFGRPPDFYSSQIECAIQMGMVVSSTIVSVYTVGLIGLDRFLYIVHGMKYNRWMYPRRARLLIGCTWVLGLILGFLPLTGLWTLYDTQNGKKCWFILLAPPGLVLLIVTIGLVPVLMIIVLYGIILYHAIKKVLQLRRADKNRTNENGGRDENLRIFRGGESTSIGDETAKQKAKNRPSRIKAVKVVLFTCGTIVVTWAPYFIACTMYVFCDPETGACDSIGYAIDTPLALLGLGNSLLNPLIYAWWHNGFRNFMRRILCRGPTIP
ncbi:glucose-dependent insulinotropic receptor-like isoform X2 [Neodiprion virginianus]|uniref:glucose-dependent insulinotropic receptor-like isoform X2 n=1 Tax=Neodiprion virginianus TaxID=2961670 RepID=UPI001EE6FEE7|nr:glucose-dependent insulinotropic receptor-like isoform X2 [Neodiprion virginianus]